MQNYDMLVKRIADSANMQIGDVEKRIEARRAKLSGLISKEGAAQIIAAELGVKFDSVQLKISELVPGMKRANIIGKVINLFPVKSFDKNGKSGKVANLIVADETGNIRVVLWDVRHISLVENGEIRQDYVVEITNGSVREGEIHLSGFSDIKRSSVVVGEVKKERSFNKKEIVDLQEGNGVDLRGVVVQVFSPRFFFVCPECGKKANSESDGFSCAAHGRIAPQERALLNFVLDDGTENLRAVLFSDKLEKMITMEKLKDSQSFTEFKDNLLGSEVSIRGVVKKNALFNNLELSCQEISFVDPSELIETLEKEQ